ncbi:HIT family protein [bacterium]|nr:HIT family protein [bacterium]
MATECIFCKIVAGTIPCHKVAETDAEIAFLDIMPVTRGHVLVVPKRHVECVTDAPPETMANMMRLATRIAHAARAGLRCDGMNILVNSGAVAGQLVPHVHLHVIPRYEDDGVRIPWPHGSLDKSVAPELVSALRAHL